MHSMYMWEGGALEDELEFETDVIGNTNEIAYTNKRLIQMSGACANGHT